MRQSFRACRWWQRFGAIAVVLTLLVCGRTAAQAPSQKPNSIPSADFGEDAGHPLAQSMTFFSFYTTMQHCAPNRAEVQTFFTGKRYPGQTQHALPSIHGEDGMQYAGFSHPNASMYVDRGWLPDVLLGARLSLWSLTPSRVAAILVATIYVFHTVDPAGQRLLDLRMLDVVFVLLLSTATLGLTDPAIHATEGRRGS